MCEHNQVVLRFCNIWFDSRLRRNSKSLESALKLCLIVAEKHEPVAHMEMQGRHAETAARLACQDAGKE